MDKSPSAAKNISIVYFGSGRLATSSLEFLQRTFMIEAVITKPRPAHHHGSVPVIEFCEATGIRCLTPANKQELSETFQREELTSQLGVVIDYGIIINQDVIDAFPLGIVNSHFSLLPEWRGADPITSAILSGQTQTGVSLMLINDKMDEGPLLAQAAVDITSNTTATSLTADLIDVSNALLAEVLPLYSAGSIQPTPQTNSIGNASAPSYSRKLTKDDGTLDWAKPAAQLVREVHAYIEWPKSRTTLGSIDVIVTAAHSLDEAVASDPGQIEVLDGAIRVSTIAGYFYIDQLKPTGKKEMSAAEFIRGYGARLTNN